MRSNERPNCEKRNYSEAASISPSAEKVGLRAALSEAVTLLYTHGCLTVTQRDFARRKLATVKDNLTVEPVSNRYKFGDSLLPWIVTKAQSGGRRFIIDSRDAENREIFSGFMLSATGKIGSQRLNFHRSHFVEDLPACPSPHLRSIK